jgi:hypothetical protein
MKTFQDLMQEHPEVTRIDTNGPDILMDLICRCYATWWGNLTDTHMTLQKDGTYIITGSRINSDFIDSIMYCRKLRGCDLPYTFAELLGVNGMIATFTEYNGQRAVAVGCKEGVEKGVLTIPPITTVRTSSVYNPAQCCSY